MTVAELIAKLQTIPDPGTAVVLTHSPHCCHADEPRERPEVHYDLPHHTVYIVDWPGEYRHDLGNGEFEMLPHKRAHRMPPEACLLWETD